MHPTKDRHRTPPNKENLPPMYNRSASPGNMPGNPRIKIKAPKQIKNFRTMHEDKDRKLQKKMNKQQFMDFFNTKKSQKNRSQRNERYEINERSWNGIGCANHDGKDAKFRLEVEGELLYYCSKCAVKLASQGFLVNKLEQEIVVEEFQPQISKVMRQKQNNYNIPSHRESQFEKSVDHTMQTYAKTIQTLSEIDNNYRTQYTNTQNYYTQLMEVLEQLKWDNLNDIQHQWRRNSQISHIQCGYLYDNLEEIHMMKEFTEQQWGNQEERNMRIKFYKQKLDIFLHKIEEIEEFIAKIPNIDEQSYHQNFSKIQKYLLTNTKPTQTQSNQVASQQTLINILPSQSRYEMPRRNTEMLINPSKLIKMCENKNNFHHDQGQAENSQTSLNNGRKVNAFRRLFGNQGEGDEQQIN